jgi:hypothetical protein
MNDAVHICTIDETDQIGEEDMVMPLPALKYKPQKKDIKYGPAPKQLVDAVRAEMLKLVKAKDFEDQLGTIGRLANQAGDLLMCLKTPEAVMKNEHGIVVPGVLSAPSNVETYGATMIREIMGAVQSQGKKDSPEDLVRAIALAREHGMTDLSAELEVKLTGKKLDGKRPMKRAGVKTAEDYLDEVRAGETATALTSAVLGPPPLLHGVPKASKKKLNGSNGVTP